MSDEIDPTWPPPTPKAPPPQPEAKDPPPQPSHATPAAESPQPPPETPTKASPLVAEAMPSGAPNQQPPAWKRPAVLVPLAIVACLLVVAIIVTIVVTGQDTKTSAFQSTSSANRSIDRSTTGATTSKKPEATTTGKNETIADYIKENGITETAVKRGDPGAPVLDLPTPEGWEDAGSKTPEWAYGAIVYADPTMASDPPTITAIMSKLTGDVDQAKIFEFAPGELKNLPGFEGAGEGGDAKLAGFDAFQIGGSYVRDGVKRMIAQKTVFIPAKAGDGAFVLQFNADGTEDQMAPLMDATSVIDEKTTITP